jgi:uncharacterized membrane protein (DUF2068 family)
MLSARRCAIIGGRVDEAWSVMVKERQAMRGQAGWTAPNGDRPRRGAPGLYTIIGLKLGKSLLLFGITLGIYSLMDEDLRAEFERFLRWVRLDPEHKFFVDLGARLQEMTPSNVRWIASGTFLYGLLLLVESVGMMFRVFWAAWLAVGETAFFIPIEIYDLMRDFSLAVFVILWVNVGIVWYLVKNRDRLFHHVVPSTRPSPATKRVEPSA